MMTKTLKVNRIIDWPNGRYEVLDETGKVTDVWDFLVGINESETRGEMRRFYQNQKGGASLEIVDAE